MAYLKKISSFAPSFCFSAHFSQEPVARVGIFISPQNFMGGSRVKNVLTRLKIISCAFP